uniref:F5/8 type C domain-containing protein n=1 Tax=Biomphalaria glabrata TaxID=6526 RepID=A0A2C9KYV1_BIOGL
MGLTNPLIVGNSQITSSSNMDHLHGPTRGRLYTEVDDPLGGAWSPYVSDKNQYIQVDFLAPYQVSAVVTQGSPEFPFWVTKYTVYYSTDGINYYPVVDSSGKPTIFNGNTNQYNTVTNYFSTVVAQFIQIRP